MDLYSMYLPDALSYTSFRSPVHYRDYETQPFENKQRSYYGCKEKQQSPPLQHGGHIHSQQQVKARGGKDNCPFCKEEKRRPLVAYLRGKANATHRDIITEEEEEEPKVDQEKQNQDSRM